MESTARAQYEEDKAKLLEKVKSSLDQLQANLNSINRNLESANAVGSQFQASSYLWSSFHKVIAPSTDNIARQSPNTKDALPSAKELEEKSLGEEQRL
ncbi:hypothetical protein [Parasitella parasitica]|uniref:DASH complex subunit DAD1 n=1 Tax=Parasitella parasitica TaxID=35722 RepID=A0A0B7NIJ4_9FUNG|nr:hypothetical protein [Parasitella parasitica]